MPEDILLVIDGNSLIHRAYHALPAEISTSGGIATNAVLGFTNMLWKILDEVRPLFVAVAMDKSRVTFRNKVFADYKATRKPTPADLAGQFPLVREVLAAMRIRVLELDNYEADDIIGTMAARAEGEKLTCIVLTGDRDALQLVSPATRVFLTQKGISDVAVYDAAKVKERFGVPPERYVDFRALTGDSSDNIPGVPGIGEKTAAKFIAAHGGLEELLAAAGALPRRHAELLTQYAQQARLSRELATIARDAPLACCPGECRWAGPDYPALLEVFRRLEFKKLAAQVAARAAADPDAGIEASSFTPPFLTVTDPGLASAILDEPGTEKTALVWASTGRELPYALGVATGKRTYVFPGAPDKSNPLIRPFLNGLAATGLYLHHAKEFWHLTAANGLPGPLPAFDTMLAAYLLNPAQASRSLAELAADYLGIELSREPELALAAGASVLRDLVPLLAEALAGAGLAELFDQVEMPLIEVLAAMEHTGIKVDPERLAVMSSELDGEITRLADRIYEQAGEDFNLNSPRQLAVILFEKLKLPAGRKTKTGYSTNAAVLENLADKHEIVALILHHRQLVKLKSTYVDAMVSLIDPATGCLHTTFQQALTATGRLSSVNPNLQNIPVRLEEGRRIRKVFIPRAPGNLILTADYSQIELRLLAHLSGDENLRAAFMRGEDIHTRTAAEICGVPPEMVTREMRSAAKAVNFGIIYGISDFGLARNTGISVADARRYIDGYFRRYPTVRAYLDSKITEARSLGYVTTLFNRRRWLPDLLSPNRAVRAAAERTAVNTPLQGTAADIIKVAMVRIHRLLREGGLQTLMLLQVHDELIFEVPRTELAAAGRLIKETMENAVELAVPLTVDLKAGPDWYDVQDMEVGPLA